MAGALATARRSWLASGGAGGGTTPAHGAAATAGGWRVGCGRPFRPAGCRARRRRSRVSVPAQPRRHRPGMGEAVGRLPQRPAFRGQFVRAVLAYAGKTWTEGDDD